MDLERKTGRVTIPTDVDIVPETLEVLKKWGGDALRDADGTEFSTDLVDSGAKIYATYYTTRKDNAWAKAHPEEVQQCYILSAFVPALSEGPLAIPLMKGISDQLIAVNTRDSIERWWEVIDRTTGQVIPYGAWTYDEKSQSVVVEKPVSYHEYTASFLAYLIWDPVHMYNAVTNGWKDFEHQITFDVRQPKTRAYSMDRLRRFIEKHPYVDVIRYTTFFHQFSLLFDELRREKYVDWYGYSASVSPYILEQFEQEVGYPFRPEYIIDQGYYNNQYRLPSKEFLDFVAFQRREVAKLAKEMVDITHEYGKEAMMFLGDHWIGTEPYMPEFSTIGLDAVVGSVGNGMTLRLLADIEGVRYHEGRFLPYFFPDSFYKGANPVALARENWVTARRAMLRKPVDRIGYGGYLKLALDFPDFMDYIEKVTDEFRDLYDKIQGQTPYTVARVGVLNAWGKSRSWGCHMVHHALYHKSNYSYAGVIEALSGAPVDVVFLSFDDLKQNPDCLKDIDVLVNVGDADTAQTGGVLWEDADLVSTIRGFIAQGGGWIGVGQPSGHAYQGHFFQLAGAMGVEQETGFTLGYDKYNWQEHPDHFLLEDGEPSFGESKRFIYALEDAEVLVQKDREVQMAVHQYGKGRSVYLTGLPYTALNARVLLRSILWSMGQEDRLRRWFSSNYYVDVHAYVEKGLYCVVNNTEEVQKTIVYRGDGSSAELSLAPNALVWFPIE